MLIFSINTHEKPKYLSNQIDNINNYVKIENKVILSCNELMHYTVEDNRVLKNPEIIEKKRFHGSILCGIYSNMKMALNIGFEYFIIMSSRDFFYRDLKTYDDICLNVIKDKFNDYNTNSWHWPNFKKTNLFNYTKENNMFFSSSAHEGLCFSYNSCVKISEFLEKNSDIKEDLFNFSGCVEEFALQTICCNFDDYYNIGNGVYELSPNALNPNKLTHKRQRK